MSLVNVFFNPHANTIFVDMDGVVADFDAYVLQHLGRTFEHAVGPAGDTEMWDFIKSRPNFYAELPPTPYAFELWDLVTSFGANVEILTAIPRRSTVANAESDKRAWIARYFGPEVPVRIGPYSRDKWKHCGIGDILIDDRADNIEEWAHKGNGLGVLHHYNDYQSTADRLRRLIENDDLSCAHRAT